MSGPGSDDDLGPAGETSGSTGPGRSAPGDTGPTSPDPGGSARTSDAPVRLEPTEVLSGAARRRRAQRPVTGRTTAIVAVVAVVLGVAIFSALAPPPAPAPTPASGDGTTIAPVDAHASSFFCTTGAGADAGAGATATIVLTNTSATPAVGFETAVSSSGGTPQRIGVSVSAHGTGTVDPAAGLPAGGAAAASFAFARGGVTGTVVVSGPQGWSTAPCVTQVSPEWDFAGGSTASGLLDLSLYNPTAAPAVVDVTFLTDGGIELDPQAYQGISVAPGQLVVETLGSYVQNQSLVATLVQAVSGALVAGELDQMAVPTGSGLALLAGTPGPSSTWRFAQTTAVSGGSVTLAVANPGSTPVAVRVTAGLPGATVLPRQLIVPARTVAPYAVSTLAGWPLGSAYSLKVSATSPIVVGRTVVAPAGGAPPQAGIAGGTTVTAPSWLVVGPGQPGAPAVPGGSIASLAVSDPGTSPVDVTVSTLLGGRPLATARVAAGGVALFGSKLVGGVRPLVVTASGPITVEMDGAPTGAPGVVSSSGFALGT